jgi:hypothetical protein
MRTDGERQSGAIDGKRMPFLVVPISGPLLLSKRTCIDEAFFFIQRASVSKLVSNVRQTRHTISL